MNFGVTSHGFAARCCLALACLLPAALPAAPDVPARLHGIVTLQKTPHALLQLMRGRALVQPILAVGEATENLAVTAIDETKGTVTVRFEGSTLTLTLPPLTEDLAPAQRTGSLRLHRAPLSQVLDIYQTLSGKTLLPYPLLIETKIDLAVPGSSEADPLEAIEKALAAGKVTLHPDGQKFIFVVPTSLAPKLPALITELHSRKMDLPGDALAPGVLKFQAADVLQVLDVYQELVGQKVARARDLPTSKVTIRSQTSLSRGDAAYALEAVLRLSNVACLPVTTNSLKAIPAAPLEPPAQKPVKRITL